MSFDLNNGQICADSCHGCSVKLLAFLAEELDGWKGRLVAGEQANFADLSTRLEKTGEKIHRIHQQNGQLPTEAD